MVESLHQTDQGVYGHMIKLLRTHLGGKKLGFVAKRMEILQEKYYLASLRLPSKSFWEEGINIQGHEYRATMQVTSFQVTSIF